MPAVALAALGCFSIFYVAVAGAFSSPLPALEGVLAGKPGHDTDGAPASLAIRALQNRGFLVNRRAMAADEGDDESALDCL